MVPLGPRMRNGPTSFALAARDAGGCGPGGVEPDRRGGGGGVKCVFYGRDFVSHKKYLKKTQSGPMWMHSEFHTEPTRWTPAAPAARRLHVLPPAWLSDSVIPVTKRWCNPPLVERREKLTNRTPFCICSSRSARACKGVKMIRPS